MVLVIGSFCRYMLSIYEYMYISHDTFGQCSIALNSANHEVFKAKNSMIFLYVNHD